ncbi:MAG TPA: pyridoxamine 5'-phosphate oxidase family protein [Ilumatobacteraceae bacterium]|nr:pyridoxamine 5'-phosphate oxidase family protein [Ilumatobacteraceae bacterium]
MSSLTIVAPTFIEMAHRIVWCSAATVDTTGRPRTRILHPFWEWDGSVLVGWIATGRTPLKESHLAAAPYLSLNYWSPNHDTCSADCDVEWDDDDGTKTRVWDLFASGPEPVGYDPAVIPAWADGPLGGAFSVLRLDPYRLRVFPGTALLGGGGEVERWSRE